MSRFWVGGTGNWSDNTNHWASSTGGTPGATLPTSSDNVFIDGNSGAGTITVDQAANCLGFDLTSSAITTFKGNGSGFALNVFASFVGNSSVSFQLGAAVIFKATTTGFTLTSNSMVFSNLSTSQTSVQFNGVGGGWTLQDDLSLTGNINNLNGQVGVINGTFNANNHNVTCNFVNVLNSSTLNMGSGTWTMHGWGDIGNANGMWQAVSTSTINASTSTMIFDNINTAHAIEFVDVGHTYNNVQISTTLNQTIEAFNNTTITTLTIPAGSQLFRWNGGKTLTVTNFNWGGGLSSTVNTYSGIFYAGARLNSQTNGTQATLSVASGIIYVDFVKITDSNATGGATFIAGPNSIDGGNNTGWTFMAKGFKLNKLRPRAFGPGLAR